MFSWWYLTIFKKKLKLLIANFNNNIFCLNNFNLMVYWIAYMQIVFPRNFDEFFYHSDYFLCFYIVCFWHQVVLFFVCSNLIKLITFLFMLLYIILMRNNSAFLLRFYRVDIFVCSFYLFSVSDKCCKCVWTVFPILTT